MNPDLCQPPAVPGLISNLLADTDCHASALVERGYAALTTPGADTAILLTALMVLAVAFYGYRLLLGRGLVLSDATGLALRLGVVLLLAASWSSFQSTAYDLFARAPSRIASELIVAIDAPAPLDGVQSTLDRIEKGNVGWRTRAGIASPLVGGAPTAAMALNVSSFLLTLSTVGTLVVSRILLSLLLAATPVMAGFLLFDATRGVLEGWLRTLTAAAILPLFVLVLCAIELAILTPLLDRMLAQQARDIFELEDVTPVALVVIIFSLAVAAGVRSAATIARGIRLPRKAGDARVADAAGSALAPATGGQPVIVRSGGLDGPAPVVRALETARRRDEDIAASRTVAAAMRDSRAPASAAPPELRPARPGDRSATVTELRINPVRANRARRILPRASGAASRRDK